MQDNLEEPNEIQRIIFQMIELQQEREFLIEKAQMYKDKIKQSFDKRIKENISFPMIWCLGGMHEEMRNRNMGILIIYG